MSSTPGYGETPVGPSPDAEQPEWLRKAFDAQPSPSSYGARPYGAAELGDQAQGHPGQGSAQPGHSQQRYSQQGYPQPGPPQQGHPQQGHPQPGYPQPGYPQPGYPRPGSPWAPTDPRAKSRLAAGLLGIFLGALGIHRFYLGYTGVGVAMLLLTVLSFGLLGVVTSIWGLVEGILYLTDKTGSYSRDATGRPLRD